VKPFFSIWCYHGLPLKELVMEHFFYIIYRRKAALPTPYGAFVITSYKEDGLHYHGLPLQGLVMKLFFSI
jgi:hypothetical protein